MHIGPLTRDLLLALAYITLWLNLHWAAVVFETAAGASVWYPARGLSLALVLVGGLRFAPAIMVASLLGGISYHLPENPHSWLGTATWIAVTMGGTAWFLRRLHIHQDLRLRNMAIFMGAAAGGAALTALGVVAFNVHSGLLAADTYWTVALQFFVGDYLGILIVVPLALLIRAHWRPRRMLRFARSLDKGGMLRVGGELVLLIAITAALLFLAFEQDFGNFTLSARRHWFLLLLPVALLALRFGLLGAALGATGLSIAVIAVVRAVGNPLGHLDLQLLLLTFFVVGLLLGAAVSDNRKSQQALAATHRRAAQRALKEAEHARASKARFLAATTHDLRPMFEALRLGLEALKLQKLPEGAGAVLSRTESAARSISRVLDSVLDTARLEGELRAVKPRPIRLHALFVKATDSGIPSPGDNAGPALSIRSGRWQVIGDTILLERVLRNLVGNALQACGPGDRVLLAARRRGFMAQVEVHDTGRGIAREQLSGIFTDFVGHGGQGTGIGLALVREMNEQLGLGLEVASEPGRGTRFSFQLPLSSAGGASGELRRAVEAVRDRVIVIALEQLVRSEVLVSVLADWGAAVVCAPSLESAWLELEGLGGRPDLLVLDGNTAVGLDDFPYRGPSVVLRASNIQGVYDQPLAHDLQAIIRGLRSRPKPATARIVWPRQRPWPDSADR